MNSLVTKVWDSIPGLLDSRARGPESLTRGSPGWKVCSAHPQVTHRNRVAGPLPPRVSDSMALSWESRICISINNKFPGDPEAPGPETLL